MLEQELQVMTIIPVLWYHEWKRGLSRLCRWHCSKHYKADMSPVSTTNVMSANPGWCNGILILRGQREGVLLIVRDLTNGISEPGFQLKIEKISLKHLLQFLTMGYCDSWIVRKCLSWSSDWLVCLWTDIEVVWQCAAVQIFSIDFPQNQAQAVAIICVECEGKPTGGFIPY